MNLNDLRKQKINFYKTKKVGFLFKKKIYIEYYGFYETFLL